MTCWDLDWGGWWAGVLVVERQSVATVHRPQRSPFPRRLASGKEVFDETNSLHRFGFLMLDADRLSRPALQPAHDVLFHDLRRHAGIKANDLDGRRIKLRQQIGGDLRVGVPPSTTVIRAATIIS